MPVVADHEGRRLDCLDCVADLGQRLDCPNHPACAHLWQVRTTTRLRALQSPGVVCFFFFSFWGASQLVRPRSEAGAVRPPQVRVNRVHWLDTLGPTYARAMSEALYANETYVLGIDSHTNFAEGWDDMLVDMFERIGNDRAIITAYPAGYTAGADQARADLQMMMRADHITSHHITSHCIALHCIASLQARADLQMVRADHITSHHITLHCVALHCIASLQARADVQTTPSKVTTICRTRRVQVGRSRGWSCARAREGARVCLRVRRRPMLERSSASFNRDVRANPDRTRGSCEVGRSVSFKHRDTNVWTALWWRVVTVTRGRSAGRSRSSTT